MLNNLNFNVEFTTPSINRSVFSGNHDFQSGMTVISGKNESGKSLIIEMIRYALWGTKALRATTSDYVNLKSTLTFNDDYKVVRDIKGLDKVYYKGDMKASGTKPVNSYIENLLGYGMDVFDVSNACLQGKVNDLSKKTPAERKKMIDKTIGLDIIDDIINNLQTQERSLKAECSALESTLREVIEPTQPVGYTQSNILEIELQEKKEIETKWLESKHWLKTMEGTKQPEPLNIPITEPLEVLEEKQKVYVETSNTIKHHETLISTFSGLKKPVVEKKDIADQLKQWEEFKEYQKYLAMKPSVSEEDISQMETDWQTLDIIDRIKGLEQTISRMEETSIECHKCGELVCHDHEVKVALQSELEGLKSLNLKEPSTPKFTKGELKSLETQWGVYLGAKQVDEVVEPSYSPEELKEAETTYEKLAELWVLTDKLEELKLTLGEDLSSKISEVRLNKIKIDQFEKDFKIYQEYITNKQKHEEIVNSSLNIQTEVTNLQELLVTCKLYEQANNKYIEDLSVMTERGLNVTQLKDKISKLENCKMALKALKPKVKTFLVPSLNKVASSILYQITNGERRKVEIDEDFNIKVDNQKIETLSGSGETAANLALRISLGTVLTNKALSVFLGDEIDAAMDKSRVDYTAESLQNLKKTIKQIIVVSHREPEADHYIKLGEN